MSPVFGWDVGGAHVKVACIEDGRLRDVAQWSCPLWQGLEHLRGAIEQAGLRWPALRDARHAVTMTGEMVDLFADREQGVRAIVATLAQALRGPLAVCAVGERDEALRWIDAADAPRHWPAVASANWLATAALAARAVGEGVLVDIGSTTCDLIALGEGARVLARGRSDAERLAADELVYQGVVRTPLMALGPRIVWRGVPHQVMNEWFATTADVYRLTSELDPAHDQQPTADNAGKDLPATRRRLARMIGRDAREAPDADWLAFAHAWRARQCERIGEALERVLSVAPIARDAPLVAAGCGAFLVESLALRMGRPSRSFAAQAVPLHDGAGDDVPRWAQVCAPAVAVGLLYAALAEPTPATRATKELQACGS
ncbi:hydantoinase/oxoprolinase family protein [Caldimonas sp. KR1-144]|uniref:hydantoinase/oxoprolinase family protein n=1 Tax=Caldimonas sp. KR1-144 TaxID=3400911 RepID=UPI003BFF3676